jgi:hypothetical protein
VESRRARSNSGRPSYELALAAFVVCLLAPALVWAHERWVAHECLPYDKEFFRHMRGEVLRYSLMASAAVAGVVVAWYLIAVHLVERITPVTPEEKAREAKLPHVVRWSRLAVRFFLDADIEGPLLAKGERVAALVFAKIPAAVLALGVAQNWIVMPSFPLPDSTWGSVLRVVEGALAAWVAIGIYQRWLGVVLFLVFGYLIVAYGIASIDAIPVLASAFFYFHASDRRFSNYRTGLVVNAKQLAGMRLSLGIGFFLLGLVNKIYHAELFIGVGDQHPALIEGARHLIPGLSREAWSFTTALGEMTFGLLLLLGIFDKLTTIALSAIFTNFMFTFGWAEIVHLYPIAGFVVLLFRGPPGTNLDGALFRTHVALWRATGHRASPIVYGGAVACVAAGAATLLMFGPLFITVQILPRIFS